MRRETIVQLFLDVQILIFLLCILMAKSILCILKPYNTKILIKRINPMWEDTFW